MVARFRYSNNFNQLPSGVTGLTIGTTATLRWTISNAACGSTSSDMTITTVSGEGCLSYCTPSVSNGYQATILTKLIYRQHTNSNNVQPTAHHH
jgi:hypothetical protein